MGAKYLTIDEAAKVTRLGRRALYNKVATRSIPFSKPSGRLLFREDLLFSWMDRNTFIPDPSR